MVIMIGAPISAAAVEAHSKEFQLWTPTKLHFRPIRNFYPLIEIQPRLGSEVRNLDQLLIRPRIDYKLSTRKWIGVGYLWRLSNTPGSPIRLENQIFEDAGYRLDIKRLRFIARLRTEERFIQRAADMSTRLRILSRLEYSMNETRTWGLAFSNELFLNPYSVHNGPISGIDQDRLFIGIRRRVNKRAVVELGYQPVITNPQQPSIDEFGHVLLMNYDIIL